MKQNRTKESINYIFFRASFIRLDALPSPYGFLINKFSPRSLSCNPAITSATIFSGFVPTSFEIPASSPFGRSVFSLRTALVHERV